jgi:uncharacterized protein (DUF58 family)
LKRFEAALILFSASGGGTVIQTPEVINMMKLRLPRLAIAVQFTREGLIFVFLSLAIGAAAVNTGNNVLYFLFALMLGMIVLSGMISRRMLQGLKPKIQFPDHFFASVPNLCYLSIINKKKKTPSLGIRFAIRDPEFAPVSRHFFYLPPAETVNGYASIIFPNRGLYHLREIELQTPVPFSFFLKIRRYQANDRVSVYPKIYRLSEELVSRFSDGLFLEAPYRGDSQQLLHLRDYMPMDSSRRIHWKASAKAEKLLIKEYQKEQGRDLFFYFDCFAEKIPDPVMEKSISFLASLAFFFKEREIDARIVFPGNLFYLKDSIHPLLNFLAQWDGIYDQEAPLEMPKDNSAVALCLRSKEIPSRLVPIQGTRSLYLEDWQHLLMEDEILNQ